MLEKTHESPLDCKEVQSVHPKRNQSWIFIERTDIKVETPILWPHDVKSWLIWKDPDAGKDWRREEKGMTEMRWLEGIIDSMDVSLCKFRKLVMDREARSTAVHRVAKSWTWLSNSTELNLPGCFCNCFPPSWWFVFSLSEKGLSQSWNLQLYNEVHSIPCFSMWSAFFTLCLKHQSSWSIWPSHSSRWFASMFSPLILNHFAFKNVSMNNFEWIWCKL